MCQQPHGHHGHRVDGTDNGHRDAVGGHRDGRSGSRGGYGHRDGSRARCNGHRSVQCSVDRAGRSDRSRDVRAHRSDDRGAARTLDGPGFLRAFLARRFRSDGHHGLNAKA